MKTAAIYVIYHPDIDLLIRSLSSISEQVDTILLIDNSNKKIIFPKHFPKHIYINLGCNKGIAAAQNVGLRKAIEIGCEYALISDQDTIYPQGFSNRMLSVLLSSSKIVIAAPMYRDRHKSRTNEPFLQVGRIPKRVYSASRLVDLFQCIASGQFIKLKLLPYFGFMDEELFIDWVDLEWCWRARNKGFKIAGVPDIIIEHELGMRSKLNKLRPINIRTPDRHYYIVRNCLHLAIRSNSIDVFIRLWLISKIPLYIIFFVALSENKGSHLMAVSQGLWHGLQGRLGPRLALGQHVT